MTPRLLNRYIAKRVIKGILIAFLVITSIIMLVDFVELTRNLERGKGGSLGVWLLLTALNAPKLIEETIPFVVLFGVMGALYGLNKRSELIVMRAAGISAWRFLRPALFVTASLGIIWALAINPLAAASSDAHELIVTRATGTAPVSTKPGENIWLREGGQNSRRIIHAKSSDLPNFSLSEVTIYVFDVKDGEQGNFSHRIDAESARLEANGYWTLSAVIENTANNDFQPASSMSLPTRITRQRLLEFSGDIRPVSFWKLPGAIRDARQAGFSAKPLTMKFNRLLALPLMLMAMTIIAAVASMRLTRLGGTLGLMLTGGALGFGVYFVSNIMRAFGEAGSISTLMATWSIPILVLFFGLSHLGKLEDG